MARHSRIIAAALVVAVICAVTLQINRVFVAFGSTSSPAPVLAPARQSPRAPRVALYAEEEETATETETEEEEPEEEEPPEPEFQRFIADNGIDLDGDKLDNLDEWYEEGIKGKGGMPTGFMKDLVLRSFFGTWRSNGYFKMSRDYTGPNKRVCDGDYTTAYEVLKNNAKTGEHIMGKDDGTGYTWLVLGQNPGGLSLYLMKSPPFGERALALIKTDNVGEFFDKVDWQRLYVRMHKWQLWGGTAKKFPFPGRR